jgi:hypothetical protein
MQNKIMAGVTRRAGDNQVMYGGETVFQPNPIIVVIVKKASHLAWLEHALLGNFQKKSLGTKPLHQKGMVGDPAAPQVIDLGNNVNESLAIFFVYFLFQNNRLRPCALL